MQACGQEGLAAAAGAAPPPAGGAVVQHADAASIASICDGQLIGAHARRSRAQVPAPHFATPSSHSALPQTLLTQLPRPTSCI